MEFPIEMYKIREEDMKIQIPCDRCLEKGIIDRICSKCGGKGLHNKTIKVWNIAPKTVTVEAISRGTKDPFHRNIQTSFTDGLRYWTSSSEFYNEADLYLHFTKDDAQRECDKRNESIKDVLNIYKKNRLVNVLSNTAPKVFVSLNRKLITWTNF